MHNGVNIRDLNGVEASTSQFPLLGYTVLWRLAGIRVSHPDLERALQTAGFEKYLPDRRRRAWPCAAPWPSGSGRNSESLEACSFNRTTKITTRMAAATGGR